MLKKVALANVNTGKVSSLVVDTDDDSKAVSGSGKATNEHAKVTTIDGLDEIFIGSPLRGRASRISRFFFWRCPMFAKEYPDSKKFELQANRVKSPKYRGIIAEVSYQISIGEKVSDALSLFEDEFGPEIIALIRAGEESEDYQKFLLRLENLPKNS